MCVSECVRVSVLECVSDVMDMSGRAGGGGRAAGAVQH